VLLRGLVAASKASSYTLQSPNKKNGMLRLPGASAAYPALFWREGFCIGISSNAKDSFDKAPAIFVVKVDGSNGRKHKADAGINYSDYPLIIFSMHLIKHYRYMFPVHKHLLRIHSCG
jgi:hypothetical protein